MRSRSWRNCGIATRNGLYTLIIYFKSREIENKSSILLKNFLLRCVCVAVSQNNSLGKPSYNIFTSANFQTHNYFCKFLALNNLDYWHMSITQIYSHPHGFLFQTLFPTRATPRAQMLQASCARDRRFGVETTIESKWENKSSATDCPKWHSLITRMSF